MLDANNFISPLVFAGTLYGVMMLRLQKKEISQQTLHAVKEISSFIGMLNDYYLKDREEPLEFE